jgi:predicted RNase H-like HicB family nuclease
MSTQEMERLMSREGVNAKYAPSPVPRPVVTFFAILRQLFGKAEVERETTYSPPKVSHAGTWDLCVSVEPDELDGGFIAECIDVPGAMAQGETEEEALRSLIDAVQAVIAAKMEERFDEVKLQSTDLSPTTRKISVTF